jgi:hypothetical protein
MIDLFPIILEIRALIAKIRTNGEYETDGEVDEWTWKNFYFCDHVALGQSLYIDDVQVWNNW